ncbi:MAG TPA: sulfatase-like hydrolase/transferase, partial [Thermomicrobiales bacterium]|nr:sulfatase-like hydrolase/transferase [Thermomicrobiales bacterium]
TYDAACYPSPLCAPSWSSSLSGLPPHQTGVVNNRILEFRDVPSYGSELAAQGVHTVTIGKTDVFTSTNRLGFSETHLAGDRQWPCDTNFRRDPLTVRANGPDGANQYGPRGNASANDTRIVDAAVTWLDHTATTLSVNIVATHVPHYATPDIHGSPDSGVGAHGSPTQGGPAKE